MKVFRKLALAALLTALLTGTCLARETFHGAYLQGFPDGSIRPDAAVTRAELAEILYRMMDLDQRRELSETESVFADVPTRHWAYDAICAMAGARLMLGGSDGCFRPDDGVTGEELSIIFERVRAQETGKEALPELASGWASQEVTFAAGNGWVMGLQDGVLAPDEPLSRGQFAQIMNRLLGRAPGSADDLMVGMPLFSDNLDTKSRYFLDLQEAAAGHSFRVTDGREVWTGLG